MAWPFPETHMASMIMSFGTLRELSPVDIMVSGCIMTLKRNFENITVLLHQHNVSIVWMRKVSVLYLENIYSVIQNHRRSFRPIDTLKTALWNTFVIKTRNYIKLWNISVTLASMIKKPREYITPIPYTNKKFTSYQIGMIMITRSRSRVLILL